MPENKNILSSKLGILGGGQLGKMLCQAAGKWNLDTIVLDPSAECPAFSVCSRHIVGDFRKYEDVAQLGELADIVTIEIEHVNVEALRYLESKGIETRPSSGILEIIKDKGLQKKFYSDNGLPASSYIVCAGKDEILNLINENKIKIPFVQKLCRDGYDGRGVCIIGDKDQLENLLEGESIVEDLVDIKKELSVIVAQNRHGEVRCFKPVEMVFNYEVNLVDYLISPADIDTNISDRAEELAVDTVKKFGLYGILAVEMFLDKNNNLLINEVAPRPHNSGHQTIESCITSQYEQHLRALFDLPLGNPVIESPSVMLNILGEPGYEGEAVYRGLEECMRIDGVNIHIYGKKTTKPFRKMGHITILDRNINKALEKADIIREKFKVVS